MSAQTLFRTGAALTATGISFGAFGAHALRARFPDMADKSHASWMTGSSYLIYNGLALMAISAHPSVALGMRRYKTAAGLIFGGTAGEYRERGDNEESLEREAVISWPRGRQV
jgi:uncharacterized membrane protein YgdD (TMEM256/DUF423 family)